MSCFPSTRERDKQEGCGLEFDCFNDEACHLFIYLKWRPFSLTGRTKEEIAHFLQNHRPVFENPGGVLSRDLSAVYILRQRMSSTNMCLVKFLNVFLFARVKGLGVCRIAAKKRTKYCRFPSGK